VVCVIHHVHQEQFGVHFGWPLRVLGRELEGRWSRLLYGRRPMAVVSPSTRAAVRATLGLRGPIFIVPNGAPSPARLDRRRRSPSPLIGCVGRLAAHKRMDLLVHAAPELRRRVPGLTIEIAGDGPDRPRLVKLARDLAVDDIVRFLGHVSTEDKERLLGSAWLTVNPSMGEGWGIGVLEANAHGVPAVAFRVPGLRDSVRDGITGWLPTLAHVSHVPWQRYPSPTRPTPGRSAAEPGQRGSTGRRALNASPASSWPTGHSAADGDPTGGGSATMPPVWSRSRRHRLDAWGS
jgi:glycosyltransferase involved in cell wall biosynthesis